MDLQEEGVLKGAAYKERKEQDRTILSCRVKNRTFF